MAINANDIKIYQSQDNTDNDSGGGARTSVEVVDGDINNLFPDISRIDTVGGDVALRKIFPTVVTDNNDIYYGAHSIIRKKPTDPNVSALLFHTDDPYDKRLAAQNEIESYVVASYVEEFYLFGNHVAGSKAVTFLQTLNQSPPVVGEVYLLVDGNEVDQQYIRISDIDITEIDLTYNTGSGFSVYTRRRIIATIEQALEYDFVGSSFNPVGKEAGATETFATQIADAAKFYSTRQLQVDAIAGDTSVQVDSIYESIVPSTKAQSPIVNADALPSSSLINKSSNRGISSLTVDVPSGSSWIGELGVGITPNSLTFGSLTDDGEGNLVDTSSVKVATIDYNKGVITPNNNFPSTSGNVSFTPMMSTSVKLTNTGSVKVTTGNQSFVYVNNISPLPSAGALIVEYRSQGKWNELRLSDNNQLSGNDPSVGGGNLNDNGDGTGTVSLTLGSLPDLDSDILYSWGSSEVIADRYNDTELQLSLVFDLLDTNIDPLSLSIVATGQTGLVGTITSDANGVLSDTNGTITGVLNSTEGKVIITGASSSIRFSDANSNWSNVDISYDCAKQSGLTGLDGEANSVSINENPTGAEINFISVDRPNGVYVFNTGVNSGLEGVNVTFEFEYPVTINPAGSGNNNLLTGYNTDKVTLVSNSLGELRRLGSASDSVTWGNVIADGTVTINVPVPNRQVREDAGFVDTGLGGSSQAYVWVSARSQLVVDSTVLVTFYNGGVPSTYPDTVSYSDDIGVLAKYEIYLNGSFIAGEVSMMLFKSTDQHSDFFHYSKNGLVFKGVLNSSLVSKIQVGVIDYHAGLITLEYKNRPYTFNLDFFTLFTAEYGGYENTQLVLDFRTSATTITPSSLQIRYDNQNSTGLSASTDQNGNITGADIDVESYVNPTTGMVHLKFDVPTIVTGIKYDAVAITNLPIDAELLGLNPVRLPVDGRVPVFDAGRFLVIFDEVITPTTNPTPLANDVETLARQGQSYIEVIDVEGNRLDVNQYVVDKLLGTVTFNAGLILEDKYGNLLTAPFSIVDRVEDMLKAEDVQINGVITLSAALTHNYTSANSFVASALVWGDTGSRVFNLFSQEIWDNSNPVWSDSLIGDPTTAQYDDINTPIIINNANSTSGRWAIIFKSSTTVDVAHEVLGVVQTNIPITIEDVAPINPATGLPYFTMDRNGFGSGWVANNVIRFNTDSGGVDMWVIRTVQSGALTEQTDNIEIEIRGDAN